MLFVIRHSEDTSESTFTHDGKLTKKGRQLARTKGRFLIEKYGLPTAVYYSPFRRTTETMNLMLPTRDNAIPTIEVSRYFSSRERKNPDISHETKKARVSTQENHTEFRKRVAKFIYRRFLKLKGSDVVWIITHSTVYKHISRIFNVKIPSYIEPTDHFVLAANKQYGEWCSRCLAFHGEH